MIKKVIKLVGPFILVLLILAFLSRICGNRAEQVSPFTGDQKNPQQIPEETYTPPIVKIPFVTKDKQPVLTKDLPIPKKDVVRTIHIDPTTIPQGRELVLVQDKHGDLYFPSTTEKGIKVKVVKWNNRPISFGFYIGYTFAYTGEAAHCLSLDLLRIRRFYIGPDLGLAKQGNQLLAGISVKWHTLNIVEPGSGTTLRLSVLAGYDFYTHKPYVGGNLKW